MHSDPCKALTRRESHTTSLERVTCHIMSWILLCLSSSSLLGCGGSLAGEIAPDSSSLVKKTIPSGGEHLCRSTLDEAEVLVVDFPASQRVNLETMIRDHVVAVHYDCQKINVLRTCRVDGHYAFKGTLPKEEQIRLSDVDEISANLPFSATQLGTDLDSQLSRGATVDLAMMSVGQQRTSLLEVTPHHLSGRCQKATHYVHSATVGAFVMTQGEESQLNAAAKVFTTGGELNSSSKRTFSFRDGEIKACKKSLSHALKPARGCGAILKLYLIPINKTSKTKAASVIGRINSRKIHIPSCPRGLEFRKGKCTRIVRKRIRCDQKHLGGCPKRCKRDQDAFACMIQGHAYLEGKGIKTNTTKASFYLKRACDLKEAAACYLLGDLWESGKKTLLKRAAGYYDRGCKLGSGRACYQLGQLYDQGRGVPQDRLRAFKAYQEGCSAGHPSACHHLGKSYSKGQVVKQSLTKSFKFYLRSCEGGSPIGCHQVAMSYAKGKGVQRASKNKVKYHRKACRLGHAKSCKNIKK